MDINLILTQYSTQIFSVIFGLILILLFVISMIIVKVYCNKEVIGVLVSTIEFKSKYGTKSCFPKFSYIVNGYQYEEQMSYALSKKEMEECYIEGQKYTIYVWEKHPSIYVLDKKIKLTYLLLPLYGIMFICIGLFA